MTHAVVIGASGGIGAAMADAFAEEGHDVIRLSRSARDADDAIDIADEASIAAAAARLSASGCAPAHIFVATGLLHRGDLGPEKSTKMLDADWMLENYRINAVGPALVAKYFLPLMPRSGRTVFAALSARVGSISDNRSGGWHSYRAAKAALNQLIRTIAIEQARANPSSICVALHPGTVDTPLSLPFQRNVLPVSLFKPDRAALQLLDVLDGLTPADSGGHFAWDGSKVPA